MKVGLTRWGSKQESGGPELWDTLGLAHKECFLKVPTWLFPGLREDSRLSLPLPTSGIPPNVGTDGHMCQAWREQEFHHLFPRRGPGPRRNLFAKWAGSNLGSH